MLGQPNAIWNWTAPGLKVYIHLVNDRFAFKVYTVWPGQFGPTLGPVVHEGSGATLAIGKALVFEYLENRGN